MSMYYGITRPEQAVQMANDVCDVLGHGSGHAVALMVETAAQETRLGAYRDRTDYAAGTGLCQIDEIAFNDIVARTAPRRRVLLKEHFDVDLSRIQYRELEHAPLLGMLFCRLHYILVPAPVPDTVEGRAAYWKRFYNTEAGRGTPGEYLRNAADFARPALEAFYEGR